MPRSLRSSKQTGIEITDLTITNRLLTVLAAREISREECARRIRLSSRQFHRILAGGVPKLDVAVALEAVLETPLKDLFPATVRTRRVR